MHASLVTHRLAARSLLLIVSKRTHPDLVERLVDFSQDKGAVGLLLQQYQSGASLDEVAHRYWSSRLEQSGARLEDLVTATLLSVAGGVVAQILGELWKGNLGALGRVLKPDDRESLVSLARALPTRREELLTLLSLYAAKLEQSGVADPHLAHRLFETTAKGGTIQSFLAAVPQAGRAASSLPALDHLEAAARGVIATEIDRPSYDQPKVYSSVFSGLPISPRPAFGEVVALFDAPDFGLGPDWSQVLESKLRSSRLYPEAWPRDAAYVSASPKILILSEAIYRRLSQEGDESRLLDSAGFISSDSGMTSHLAVLSRTVGRGAVTLQLPEAEMIRARFALITDGRLYLYYGTPNIPLAEFDWLIGRMPKLQPRG